MFLGRDVVDSALSKADSTQISGLETGEFVGLRKCQGHIIFLKADETGFANLRSIIIHPLESQQISILFYQRL